MNLFLYLYDHLSRRRAWLCTVVLMVLGVLSLSRITYEEDINAFLPHDEMADRYASVYSHIGGGSSILVMFEGAPVDTMLAAIDEFDQAMPGHAQRAADDGVALELMDFVRTHAPYLLLEDDYARIDSILSQPGYADSSMVRCRTLLSTPMGSMAAPSLQTDPLGLFAPINRRMAEAQGKMGFKMMDGWLVSSDESRAMFWIDSPFGMSETQGNALLADSLAHLTDSLQAVHPGLSITAIGAPLIAVGNAQQIRTDGVLAVSLSALLILVLLLFNFGSLRPLLWTVISLVFGWTVALGVMALFVPNVSLIVLGIGSVIVGLAVDYPLHYLCHLRHTTSRREAVRELSRPMLTGCVTTIGSFLSLLLLQSEALHHLGLFGALMLGSTLLFALICLPWIATCDVEARPRRFHIPSLAIKNTGLVRALVFVGFCVLTVCFWCLGRGTGFDSDLMHINYMTAQQHEHMAYLDSLRPDRAEDGKTMLFAVAEGRDMSEALANNDTLLQRLGTASVYMPGLAEQQRRLERWHDFWEGRRDTVLLQLREAAVRAGFKASAFAPFEESVTECLEVLPAEDFDIMARTLCAASVWRTDTLCRITTFCPVDAVPEGLHDDNTPQRYVFTTADVSGRLAVLLNDNFNVVGLACGLMVFALLWWAFKRLEWAIVAFMPLAVSWVWILGLMRLFGLQFNVVNVILASFIFGQGADYTVFVTDGLLTKWRTGRDALTGYRQAIVLLALTTLFGIGTLVVAQHPALHSLGVVALLGMTVVVVLCLYLPPVVFGWMTNGREEPVTLARLGHSLYAITIFLSGVALLWPVLLWMRFVGRGDEEHRMRFHKMLSMTARFVINHIPGASYSVENQCGEDFSRPSLIICNHQSHLDLMAVLALTPRLIVLTKDWVWHNPLYGSFIHFAEYYPMSRGVDETMHHIRDVMSRGYSVVVFPEGTRSADRRIGRFHKGAFMMARELQCDVVEVMIHGLGHVLPKTDFMLRRGQMALRILRRFHVDADADVRELTRSERRRYIDIYEAWCEEKQFR